MIKELTDSHFVGLSNLSMMKSVYNRSCSLYAYFRRHLNNYYYDILVSITLSLSLFHVHVSGPDRLMTYQIAPNYILLSSYD